MSLNFPIFSKSRSTTVNVCEANSRVGDKTTKNRPDLDFDLSRRSRAGTKNAKVFPDPVTASHITSLFPIKSGIAWAWKYISYTYALSLTLKLSGLGILNKASFIISYRKTLLKPEILRSQIFKPRLLNPKIFESHFIKNLKILSLKSEPFEF